MFPASSKGNASASSSSHPEQLSAVEAIGLSFEDFLLARRLEAEGQPLHVDSLRVAFHALAGNKQSVQMLEKICRHCSMCNSVDRSSSFCDELKQELMVQLLVAPRKLAKYQGRGPLMQWISSMTHTTAIGLKTVSWRERPTGTQTFLRLKEVMTPESLLEERQIEKRLRQTFQSAFSRL
jgi:hypothetical protein